MLILKFDEWTTPVFILNFSQVLEVISGIKEENPREISQIIYNNTEKLFFSKH